MKGKVKDPGSALTHFIAMILACLAAVPLLIKAASVPGMLHVTALSIFIVSMILLYAASTIYHTFNISEHVNKILRKIDHMMIFILIAGTYTPFTLLVLREQGFWGWGLFLFVWLAAVAGVLLTFRRMRKVDHLKTVCYLMMGWAVIVAIKPLLVAFQASGRMESFYWLMGGGLCYTFGTIFFFLDNGRKYMHFFWHLFVLGGSACHFWAIYLLRG